MKLNEVLRKVVDGMVLSEVKDGVTLYNLLEALKDIENKELPVYGVFKGDETQLVSRVDSYRGYYEHLFIEYNTDKISQYEFDEEYPEPPYELANVGNLINALENRIEHGWIGYKGGDYWANGNTRVYIDTFGCCDGYLITGIELYNDKVLLRTTGTK